ncbi:MAG: COG4315 family predicted lipoprotein [Solirubrobacteraceae bacterium]
MIKPTFGLIAALGATAVLAAGCGSSKSSSATSAAAAYPSETTSSAAASTPAATTTSASAPTSGGGTVVAVKHASKLGTILAAGPTKLTVYMFEGDKGAVSSCSGACASVWPPVTSSGAPSVSGAAKSADLGTITRSDGTTQVTYNGHPLYFFAKDKDSGDAYGQGVHGFGADWYALKPSGSKVDNS